jgi:uncharacterized membrane protein
MTDAGGGAPAGGTSRRLRYGLIASLALNLLFVGTIGGSIWAFRHHAPWSMGGVNAHLLGFTSTLPADRKFAVWQATREERRALRPLRKEVRVARAEARRVLQTQPFDKQKFSAAQMRVLDAEVTARRAAHQLFIGVAAVLSPQEREAFARWQPAQRAANRRARLGERQTDDVPPSKPSQSR